MRIMKYCLRCSTENENSAIRCRVCGSAFFSDSVEGNSQSAERRLVCSNCKRYISDVGLVCPHCNYNIALSQNDTTVVRHLKLRHSSGAEIIVSSGEVIGRAFVGRELLKNDLYVSSSHLRATQMGKYYELKDISTNNSFMHNMNPIEKGGTAVVSTGDKVIIGTDSFTVIIF